MPDPQKEPEAEHSILATEPAESVNPKLPTPLPLLPMRQVALFPGITGPLAIGREASLRLIEDAFAGDKLVGLVAQRNPTEDKPQSTGLYTVGMAARLLRAQRLPDG